MCGLVGVATSGATDEWSGRIERALDAVEHRGPDARGHLMLEGGGATCVLGHTRLRIIDLRPEADQPIPNEDRSVWVTYNGELYNTPELRRDLERSGHAFRSNADTELIVHLYEDVDGDVRALLERLRGMFAFSLFDVARGRLVVARDRLGIKPMYLADVPNGLAYASEVRALVRAGAVEGEVDEDGFGAYLVWGRVCGPHTLVHGVRELMPGTYVD
jgi:asparagine synthase (glutamine-hydrolysing)